MTTDEAKAIVLGRFPVACPIQVEFQGSRHWRVTSDPGAGPRSFPWFSPAASSPDGAWEEGAIQLTGGGNQATTVTDDTAKPPFGEDKAGMARVFREIARNNPGLAVEYDEDGEARLTGMPDRINPA